MKIVADGLKFPESPRWSQRDGCLYLVDWIADRVHRIKNGCLETCFEIPGGGPSGLCQDVQGNLWLCLYSGNRLAVYTSQGQLLREWATCCGKPFRGPCDLVCDRQGGVFFTESGDFDEDWRSGRAAGAVYYLASLNSEPVCLLSSLHFPNGVALSDNGKYLYINEHRRNRTLRYSISADRSTLYDGQVFYEYDQDCLLPSSENFELGPDGIYVDDQDRIFVAHYGGGKVLQLSPNGNLLRTIHLQRGRRPTNVVFCWAENALFVTEAEFGLVYRLGLFG